MNKFRKKVIENNEIGVIENFTLGGYEQKVLIEGKSKDLPIVLTLHGGPGSPIPFSVGCRGLFPDFTDKFIMVYWDQLGCGINNYIIDESFTIDMFVNMTVDLIKEIKQIYPNHKLFLFAVSWGSVLSAKAMSIIPELIDGVVVYGQVLKELTFNKEIFDACEKSSAPKKTKELINNIEKTQEYTVDNLKLIFKFIFKYTDGYKNKTGKIMPIASVIIGLLSSPDYRFRDFIAIVKNGYNKNKSLFLEMIKIDNRDVLSKVTKPYFIIQGSTDIVTSTKSISEFVSICGNSNLHCEIIENSGH
ncbi:MAG: alpha/beta fold hydrolase, partial [Clostridium sp.]